MNWLPKLALAVIWVFFANMSVVIARGQDVPWSVLALGGAAVLFGFGLFFVISHPKRRSDLAAKASLGGLVLLGVALLVGFLTGQVALRQTAGALIQGLFIGCGLGQTLIGMRPSMHLLSVDDRAKLGKP